MKSMRTFIYFLYYSSNIYNQYHILIMRFIIILIIHSYSIISVVCVN